MKKTIKLLAVLLICAMLTACGKDDGNLKDNDLILSNPATTEAVKDSISDRETTPASENEEDKPYVLEFESITIDGEKFTSDCFANSKLTMINVWGTYCSPCLGEMPDLGEISDEYDDSVFQIIGVVCDVEDDASKAAVDGVKELVLETKANYTHLLLSDSLLNNLVSAAYYVPTSFFFNQDGEYLGYVESAYPKDTWIEIIEGLLKEME